MQDFMEMWMLTSDSEWYESSRMKDVMIQLDEESEAAILT